MDLGESDDEYDAKGNRKCYCASRPCGPRGCYVSASTLLRQKKADLAAGELGARSWRPDCETDHAFLSVNVGAGPAPAILGGQQRVTADDDEGGVFFYADDRPAADFCPAR
jgi:hypothetical protein